MVVMAKANFKKVASFLLSNRRNIFKGTFNPDSLRKNSLFLKIGTGISPPKTNWAPFHSTSRSSFEEQLLRNPGPADCYDQSDNTLKAYEYKTEIERLCKRGETFGALYTLDEMVEMGYKPYVQSYISIIDVFLRDGSTDSAFEMFVELAFHRSILPQGGSEIYSSLVHYVRTFLKQYDIYKLLEAMKEEGVPIDVRTYNVLLDAYCKEGWMEEAESLVKIMRKLERGTNVTTYRCLIEGYSLKGEMSKSREAFDWMTSLNAHDFMAPDVAIYNSLINGYFNVSKMEEAMSLFDEMMKKCVEYGAIVYDNMGLSFQFVKPKCFEEMLLKHLALPDECTFKIVMEGLCNNNHVDEALSLFRSIDDEELNSSVVLYNALIYGAGKNGKLAVAKMLYNEMTVVKRIKPNAMTYGAVTNGFLEEGLVEKAKE